MNHEHAPNSPENSPEKARELAEAGAERKKELNEQLERKAEASPDTNVHELAKNAEKLADKPEKKVAEEKKVEKQPVLSPASRRAREKANFNRTMKEARQHMSAPSRAFSKVIHAKPVEKTSEIVGSTVARPNAILAGSVSAFVLTLVIYLVARYYGYPLSGFETIAAFILGWVVGILFDYLRVMITGKRV